MAVQKTITNEELSQLKPMEKEISVDTFTKSSATFLLNSIAETIEYDDTEEKGMNRITMDFNNVVESMQKNGVEYADLDCDDPWLLKVAKQLIATINKDEVTLEELQSLFVSLRDSAAPLLQDVVHFTKEKLRDYDFVFWRSDLDIYLVPIWAYRILPADLVLESLNGDKSTPFQEIDDPKHPERTIRVDRPEKDIRFKHLGWGIRQEITKKES